MRQTPPICVSIIGGVFLFLHTKFSLLRRYAVSYGSKILCIEAKNAARLAPCEDLGNNTEGFAPRNKNILIGTWRSRGVLNYFSLFFIYFLIAAKDLSLIMCSILQASSAAVCSSTPSKVKARLKIVCLS